MEYYSQILFLPLICRRKDLVLGYNKYKVVIILFKEVLNVPYIIVGIK